jgi:4-hydroxybenzoate polyprenyltransferase
MALSALFNVVKEYVPVPVIVAVAANIMLVYGSSWLVTLIEEYYEEEMGRQYKFFDGKKVWLSAFWCIILSVTLALAKFIEWRELPFYLFVILGASTFLYEAFLKKIGVKKDNV